SVATLAYQENADLSKLPEPAVPEGDYELLSEEDMEERYAQNTRKGESAEENESHLNGDPSSIIARKNKKNENKGGNIYHDAV
ncbi:MAG: hypothetical protein FWG03_09320, partial [Clostridiales bacterium]|nr:hypothetical protein [Clostridiales bacterium]